MIQSDEYFRSICNTNKLGFDKNNPRFIPEEYLEGKFFVIFRTCHSFGDWVILSAMPRLLKEKYPNSTVVVPSPELLKKMYPTGMWLNKHENFHINVSEVFTHNPYVDGMVDDDVLRMPIYHDHFRIYDPDNTNIPLTEQMLTYWRFDPLTITDSAPELYWSDEEKKIGDEKIKEVFCNNPFGFLYIDDSFFEGIDESKLIGIMDPLAEKRKFIQKKINEVDNITWLYYAGKDISNTHYTTKSKAIDVRGLKTTLRIQNYIKSKSKLLIGHQGGYGSDCMSRYTECHVVPVSKPINEHFIRTTNYIQI